MTSEIQTITQIGKLRQQVALWKKQDQKIAFVPTMGALHDGHLSLIKQAQKHADKVIISIFVNPTQFGVGEDLSLYPRPLEADKDKLIALNADLLYMPSVTEMYPDGFATSVHVSGISSPLCGQSRPTHFDGVALIVTKLLLQTMPDCAFFGEKDFQQLMVIKKMVKELNIPVQIDSVPIFREADGLAMSSRNVYLTPEQRQLAPLLHQTMTLTQQHLTEDKATIERVLENSKNSLKQHGFKIDYFELRDSTQLELVTQSASIKNMPARLFAAAYLGNTRLIDNIEIDLTTIQKAKA